MTNPPERARLDADLRARSEVDEVERQEENTRDLERQLLAELPEGEHMNIVNPQQGWGNPHPFSTRAKFHYYGEDGRSLCGKWGRVGDQPEVEQGMDDHTDNCAACKRKLAKAGADA